MATVTTAHKGIDITESTPERLELVRKAQEADIAEHGLTIKQALRRYKKAVAWAFALSVCLVMDGYDVGHFSVIKVVRNSYPGRGHYLILRTDTIPRTIRYSRRYRRISNFTSLAIRSIQFFGCRSIVRFDVEWMVM